MSLLAGLGTAMTNFADRRLAKYDAEDLAAARQQAEINKEKRMEEFAIRGEGRTDARATAQRGLVNAERRAEDEFKFSQSNDPERVKTEISTARTKSDAAAEAKREYDRKATLESATPEMLKAERAKKLAGHIEPIDRGAGLRSIQIETARLSLDEKKKVNTLMAEAETTKDPARRAEIIQALTMRGIIKRGEFDTEKVTTETMNDDGSVNKIERTQKRPAGAASSSAPEKPGVTPRAEYDKMPIGARYTAPDGKTYVKGK